MEKGKNYIKFTLEDNTHLDGYNESCEMTNYWYGEVDDGQVMTIEDYYYCCKSFAATMGFTEKTINDWFGDF